MRVYQHLVSDFLVPPDEQMVHGNLWFFFDFFLVTGILKVALWLVRKICCFWCTYTSVACILLHLSLPLVLLYAFYKTTLIHIAFQNRWQDSLVYQNIISDIVSPPKATYFNKTGPPFCKTWYTYLYRHGEPY